MLTFVYRSGEKGNCIGPDKRGYFKNLQILSYTVLQDYTFILFRKIG